MDFSQILVYILAVTLFVLLVMSVIFMYNLLKVIRNVRDISNKADHAADNLLSFSEVVRKSAKPAALSSIVGYIAKQFSQKSKGGKKRGKK